MHLAEKMALLTAGRPLLWLHWWFLKTRTTLPSAQQNRGHALAALVSPQRWQMGGLGWGWGRTSLGMGELKGFTTHVLRDP